MSYIFWLRSWELPLKKDIVILQTYAIAQAKYTMLSCLQFEISHVSINKNEHNAYRPLIRLHDSTLLRKTMPTGIRPCPHTPCRVQFTHKVAAKLIKVARINKYLKRKLTLTRKIVWYGMQNRVLPFASCLWLIRGIHTSLFDINQEIS